MHLHGYIDTPATTFLVLHEINILPWLFIVEGIKISQHFFSGDLHSRNMEEREPPISSTSSSSAGSDFELREEEQPALPRFSGPPLSRPHSSQHPLP